MSLREALPTTGGVLPTTADEARSAIAAQKLVCREAWPNNVDYHAAVRRLHALQDRLAKLERAERAG